MNRRSAALLSCLLPTIWACAEGGTRGSGIGTTVRGNVASIQTAVHPAPFPAVAQLGRGQFVRLDIAEFAQARTEIEGIRVAVEGSNAASQTDENGHFTVRGDFDGLETVIFELPDDGGRGRIIVNVPGGGTLSLNNVRVDARRGEASAETQQVEFEGIVSEADCRGGALILVSAQDSPGDVDEYTVRLDGSTIRDAQGEPVACTDLPIGARLRVEGVVNLDGSFGDATIELL